MVFHTVHCAQQTGLPGHTFMSLTKQPFNPVRQMAVTFEPIMQNTDPFILGTSKIYVRVYFYDILL